MNRPGDSRRIEACAADWNLAVRSACHADAVLRSQARIAEAHRFAISFHRARRGKYVL